MKTERLRGEHTNFTSAGAGRRIVGRRFSADHLRLLIEAAGGGAKGDRCAMWEPGRNGWLRITS